MSTTSWISPLNAAWGLATDDTYIYVTNSQDKGGYGINIDSYKISDNGATTNNFVFAAGNNSDSQLTIDNNYLYASYIYSSQSVVTLLNYPAPFSYASITFLFSSYYVDDPIDPFNPPTVVNPTISAIVIAGGYLYASFYGGFLGRVVLQSGAGDYNNDTSFGASGSGQPYATSGYNDLNNSLYNQTTRALATDGTYLYVGCYSGKIVRMTLSSTSSEDNWLTGFSGITGLTVSSDNLYLYILTQTNATITQVLLSDKSTVNTYTLTGGSYANNLPNGLVVTGGNLYVAYYGTGATANNGSILRYGSGSSVPCFGENTKILCYNSEKSLEEYVLIQDIRKGTLVKTLLNGYLPVDMIGKSTIHNHANNDRIKNRLYKCTKENYPELVYDELILTGCHSILVGKLTDEQVEKTLEELDKIYITDKNYRLLTFLDPRAETYQVEGELPIYHLALENENYYMNYGIFANGLLVESCSKRYLKELSGMTLIE
jgi:hypothetical protein